MKQDLAQYTADEFDLDVRIVEFGPVAAALLADTDDGCDTRKDGDCRPLAVRRAFQPAGPNCSCTTPHGPRSHRPEGDTGMGAPLYRCMDAALLRAAGPAASGRPECDRR